MQPGAVLKVLRAGLDTGSPLFRWGPRESNPLSYVAIHGFRLILCIAVTSKFVSIHDAAALKQ
jgi:hypothetical protein